jgi:ferredoxin
MMRVTVDPDLCSGHGRCYRESPDLFEADWQGHGSCRFEEVPVELEDAARRAIDACPESAIAEA